MFTACFCCNNGTKDNKYLRFEQKRPSGSVFSRAKLKVISLLRFKDLVWLVLECNIVVIFRSVRAARIPFSIQLSQTAAENVSTGRKCDCKKWGIEPFASKARPAVESLYLHVFFELLLHVVQQSVHQRLHSFPETVKLGRTGSLVLLHVLPAGNRDEHHRLKTKQQSSRTGLWALREEELGDINLIFRSHIWAFPLLAKMKRPDRIQAVGHYTSCFNLTLKLQDVKLQRLLNKRGNKSANNKKKGIKENLSAFITV